MFTQKNAWLNLVVVFIVISGLFYLGTDFFNKNNISVPVILGGNAVLFIASIISFFMHKNAMNSSNNSVFFRNTYGGFLIKMLMCIIAAFIYIYTSGNKINKAAIFVCMGLYLIYTFTEVYIVLKKPKNNG